MINLAWVFPANNKSSLSFGSLTARAKATVPTMLLTNAYPVEASTFAIY
ncbi:hypothetical protein ABEW68_26430 [Paenibacillus lautus]